MNELFTPPGQGCRRQGWLAGWLAGAALPGASHATVVRITWEALDLAEKVPAERATTRALTHQYFWESGRGGGGSVVSPLVSLVFPMRQRRVTFCTCSESFTIRNFHDVPGLFQPTHRGKVVVETALEEPHPAARLCRPAGRRPRRAERARAALLPAACPSPGR